MLVMSKFLRASSVFSILFGRIYFQLPPILYIVQKGYNLHGLRLTHKDIGLRCVGIFAAHEQHGHNEDLVQSLFA